MGHYKSNLRDIEFNLFEVLRRQDVLGAEPYPDLDDYDFVSAFSLLSRDVADIIAESRSLRERAAGGGGSS